MLIFKSIRYKNLLSTGNIPNCVELNKASTTLITGKNGDGKSTILCALTFGLFGKPFRNISKNQLVNSINNKNCLVEIDFAINGHEYTVKRGIKPAVFEIWCDGVMINQNAAQRDYQKVLEQQILKLNYKTFTQVVILGSATFVPFMQLTTSARREVIEDILDIKVFSVMNSLLKEKIASVKDEIIQSQSDISRHSASIQNQDKLISVLEVNHQAAVDSINNRIAQNQQQIQETQLKIEQVCQQIDSLKPKADGEQLHQAISVAKKMKVKMATTINVCDNTKQFFIDNTTCPTCTQQIADEHKQVTVDKLEQEIQTHQTKLDQVCVSLDKMNEKLQVVTEAADKIRDLNIKLSTYFDKINILNHQNTVNHKELSELSVNNHSLVEERAKKELLEQQHEKLYQHHTQLVEQRQVQTVAATLLKDTGIKTAIISEYLPVMNTLINKFLSAMDFYVRFELDESFNEVIRSRNRDVFTYESFSEGEKQKINLAILFAWRQIAKMKNSVNTNLLIMDEIMDSSLDANGVDIMMSLIGDLPQTNLFVISHRDVAEKFNNIIRVEKVNEFSVLSTTVDL